MTTIQTVINHTEHIYTIPTKKEKLAYITALPADVQQFLSGSINMVGIGPEIAQEITVWVPGSPSSSLEYLIEAFDTASKIGSSTEKRIMIRGIILSKAEKDFVMQALYSVGGSLKLGVKVPRISDGISDVISAMLAKSKPFDLDTSVIEQKFDGHRCIARKVDEDTVILHSRNGKPMTVERVTNGLMETLPVGTAVDGEIVAGDGEFQSLKIHGNDVTYQIFDCLYIDNQNIMGKSLIHRRKALESLETTDGIYISEILDFSDMESLDAWVEKTGAEGIIAKDPHGTYRAGKRDWIKYKKMHDLNAQVVDWEYGKGKRANVIGAIHVIPEGLTATTKVGSFSGITDQDLVNLTARVRSGEPLRVEVKYQDITRDGRLRFPVFVRVI